MNKPKEFTPTKAKFKLFGKEVRYWVTNLGLMDWEVDVFLAHEGGDPHEASCHWDIQGMRASIVLNKAQRYVLSDLDIKKAAFHEVAHLLIARLESEAESRSTTGLEIDTAAHGIINRLSNMLYG